MKALYASPQDVDLEAPDLDAEAGISDDDNDDDDSDALERAAQGAAVAQVSGSHLAKPPVDTKASSGHHDCESKACDSF